MPINFREAKGVHLLNSPINDIAGHNNVQNVRSHNENSGNTTKTITSHSNNDSSIITASEYFSSSHDPGSVDGTSVIESDNEDTPRGSAGSYAARNRHSEEEAIPQQAAPSSTYPRVIDRNADPVHYLGLEEIMEEPDNSRDRDSKLQTGTEPSRSTSPTQPKALAVLPAEGREADAPAVTGNRPSRRFRGCLSWLTRLWK